MVAVNRTAGFAPGQPVKVLVIHLAWVYRRVRGGEVPDESRFLYPSEPFTFAGANPGKPGGVLIRDGRGVVFACPVGFLEESEG